MAKRNEGLAVAFHFVDLRILPCPVIEDLLVVKVLFGNRSREAPHDVAKAYCGTHVRRQVHGSNIAVFVDHWNRRVYLFEVDLLPE